MTVIRESYCIGLISKSFKVQIKAGQFCPAFLMGYANRVQIVHCDKVVMERIHIIVQGRVQGVGFRYHTQLEAKRSGLTGYVQNRPDGTVEIEVEGERRALNTFLEWVRQGPPTAEVKRLDMTSSSATGEFVDFRIQR
ncbi:MAG: acylphosphatase [Cyanobacteria bacterium P01_F01_bin.56]